MIHKSLIISFVFFISQLLIANNNRIIYGIDLKKDVGSTTWLYIKNGFKEAEKLNASTIIINMNTYGGAVVYADSIRTKILNSKIPVIVFIDNNAASAGALIAVACDSIYMRKGANIGAASVVNDTGEKMPDKYQSYMRATIRATAEAHGKDTIVHGKDTLIKWRRDPRIAEAFVDEHVFIPGIIDSTHILTFTAEEALIYGYCEGIVENINEIITDKLHYSEYTYVEYKPTTYDEVKGFLTNPAFQVILIMLIIGGIYFELQSPGIGFPTIIALAATLLYFTPLFIDGLAEYWEIALFVVGLILIVMEIFVIPGFGIAGISGIILVITGLCLALINNVNFDFSGVESEEISNSVFKVFAGIVLSVLMIAYLSSKIGSKGIFRKLALESTQDTEEGYIGVPGELSALIGEEGIARTILRPSGLVDIKGETYDAVAETSFIEKGTKVKVIRYETGQIYVEPIQ